MIRVGEREELEQLSLDRPRLGLLTILPIQPGQLCAALNPHVVAVESQPLLITAPKAIAVAAIETLSGAPPRCSHRDRQRRTRSRAAVRCTWVALVFASTFDDWDALSDALSIWP